MAHFLASLIQLSIPNHGMCFLNRHLSHAAIGLPAPLLDAARLLSPHTSALELADPRLVLYGRLGLRCRTRARGAKALLLAGEVMQPGSGSREP
jgi:hypothetical protein